MKLPLILLLFLFSCSNKLQPKHSKIMGLDTTHDAWHGPYSSFNRFRHKLADKIGINLQEYTGYNNTMEGKDLETIEHPLKDFFNHSDCDGDFSPEQCKIIAESMDEIIKTISVPEHKYSPEYDFIEDLIRFRDGCLLAYSKKENLEFH